MIVRFMGHQFLYNETVEGEKIIFQPDNNEIVVKGCDYFCGF